MKKILVLPTWILVRSLNPFLPSKHEWKNKRFSLSNWASHSTDINNAFSIFFWWSAILLIFTFINYNS